MVNRKKISEKSSPAPKAKRGRPATGRVRARMLGVRGTDPELDAIEAAAEKDGMTPGKWLLSLGLAKAGYTPQG